ncbi:TRAP transporter small permease subunit [Campylobacter sp. 19-13652]|uniref:TRAP transporter small permease subunit n=1 Tax=Campylobacter sp. 19-13652 TaxID=2840180 RepID=UPI001C76914A|nr:TRAP transporter small permease subunit [Campylobacter sp. 19-13652]BCX79090.1 C4-dicarboxylate ABC transporter [Campylobacter sp. 19-13652]
MLNKIVSFFDVLVRFVLSLSMAAMLLLILVVLFNVVSRYLFSYSNVGLSELEWHLFAVIFLLGMSCCLYDDSHVRVDIFYANISPRKKALINIIFTILFVIPLALLISQLSLDYVAEAYQSNEASADPGGLSHRFIIKALIPLSFYLLIFISFGTLVKNLISLKSAQERGDK